MSKLLNETFQKHLGLLHKKLKLNEADQGELPLSTLVPQIGTKGRMKKNPNDSYNSSDISQQTKENLWDDFQTMSVKDFVDKYGKEFSDPKFHAFISAGLADKINDESFKVTQVSPLVTTLIPTQNEIGFGNSLNDLIKKEYDESVQLVELDNMLTGKNVKLKAKTGEVPIVIFNGEYIIDGHHRWSKIYCANKTATVFCLNFESPALKNDPSMALKAFHLAIAKMLRNSPTENKSGKNLFQSNRNEIYQYIYEYLFSPPGYSSPFLDVFKKHSNLINSNLNEAEQQFLIDPKTTLNTKALNPASADPFAKTVSLYIANNAQALISNNKPATDTPRSHMPQTDRAPGYEDALEKGEINFLPDKVTEKMVNETFQRHIKLLHKKLNLNENVDINQTASTLQFKPVTKQKLVYKYVENGKPGSMSPMTYTKSTVQQPVVTTTTDGKETQNTAEVGDIIMSGATGENYVVKAAKLPKLYTGNVGSDIYPEQSPRQVALYSGEPVTFKAPWGEDMVIKPGDYLVKDPANTGYYRIAKVEFEKTYNKL